MKSKKTSVKNCTLYTILDMKGLQNFYSETHSLASGHYDADSFYNIICDEAPFGGPSNQVLLFEPNIKYTWQMNDLANLTPGSNGTLPSIVSFEFCWLGTAPVNWDAVFDTSGWDKIGTKLSCTKFNNAAASITTKADLFKAEPNLRLSYSIAFKFKLNSGKKVTGVIDPLIDNRGND